MVQDPITTSKATKYNITKDITEETIEIWGITITVESMLTKEGMTIIGDMINTENTTNMITEIKDIIKDTEIETTMEMTVIEINHTNI